MLRFVRSITLIQWMVMVAILATLAAILIPPVKWASDGQREVTIRVNAFDASTMQPLTGVEVTLICGPADSPSNPPPFDQVDEGEGARTSSKGTTDSTGTARLTGSFRSSASYLNPKGRIHLHRGWLVLRAAGYGGATIPVRHESMSRAEVIEMGEVPVSIGLVRSQ